MNEQNVFSVIYKEAFVIYNGSNLICLGKKFSRCHLHGNNDSAQYHTNSKTCNCKYYSNTCNNYKKNNNSTRNISLARSPGYMLASLINLYVYRRVIQNSRALH